MDKKQRPVSFKKLDKLVKNLSVRRAQYQSAISAIEVELSKLTGKRIVSSDFPGDGLGVMVTDENNDLDQNNYMSLSDARMLIKEKGTIDFDDFTYL